MISPSETSFIKESVRQGIRIDGRSNHQSRPLKIETSIINQASGSSRVTLGSSDVLVGVKLQVLDDPNEIGKIHCSVDCSPAAQLTKSTCSHYAQILNRSLNGPQAGIDNSALIIIPGAVHWLVVVDVLVLDDGGNLLDCIFIAIKAALYNTRLAKVTVETTDGASDFTVSDEETEILKGRELVPICITVSMIDDSTVIDTTPMEELCTSVTVSTIVNSKGMVCGVQKGLSGSVDPSVLVNMIQVK
ncbi:hypothetical protein HDV02_004546 [Globomyces sp. JEL0801]|nr:hypothetical protein HDV02_004546 [Globomyces sp. JEL0801]